MLVSTTVKFRAGSPKLKFLVLAVETTRTLLLKFPDREPDSGYGELAHISQMSQHMASSHAPLCAIASMAEDEIEVYPRAQAFPKPGDEARYLGS